MDPLNLILTALGTGAAVGSQSIAGDAIKDAYTGLKTLLQRKFTGKSSAELALTEYENGQGIWEIALKQALMQVQADRDEDIIKAAQKVMEHLQPQQVAMGKYNIQVTGNIQGYAQGDFQQVTMNFEHEAKEK